MLTGILIGGAIVIGALGIARGIRRVRTYVSEFVLAATSR
jgi:hypothetical protein